ncbi:chorion class B protein PC10-like [Papilio machaon]|uniref:chorion class B protein PC10-like n=1 Tax=Papilio machaon TaxID=76193 RepID=UPI001E665852|nr:chorion class B protein PC10-like [Papilio machaon]
MSAKAVFLIAINAFFVQAITGACWGNAFNTAWPTGWAGEGLSWAGPGLAEGPLIEAGPCAGSAFGAGWAGYGPAGAPRGFAVSSASPIPPVGMSIASDNAIEGILAVGGEVPFLGTVELEGALPTAGAGAVSFGCGNGAVGIVAEEIAPIATSLLGPGFGYGPNWAGGLGWAGCGMAPFGCGCGAPY